MVPVAWIASKKLFGLVVGMALVTVCFSAAFSPSVHALQLQQRSLRIENPASGATTRHTFTFSYVTSGTAIGSVLIEYCTSPLFELPCDAPAGVNASGAILSQQTGEIGYFIVTAQSSRLTLTRAPAQPPVNNPSSYVFDNIVNPSGAPDTFYARITTYASVDASGPYVDFGAVVNATTQGVNISTEVPPILKFCVGLSIDDDCSTAEGNLIDMGNLRTNVASSGTSQMIAATNADFGLAIVIYGTTMTSGNNVIPALASPTPSAPGNSQFGINLRANSDPPGGQNPQGTGIANPTPNYNIPNRFAFASGDTVATSPDVTDSRKFTVSYLVNISPLQAPGIYTSTLTYVCTATF